MKNLNDKDLIFEFIQTLLYIEYCYTKFRGVKGQLKYANKLGQELIKRGLLTKEQLIILLEK